MTFDEFQAHIGTWRFRGAKVLDPIVKKATAGSMGYYLCDYGAEDRDAVNNMYAEYTQEYDRVQREKEYDRVQREKEYGRVRRKR